MNELQHAAGKPAGAGRRSTWHEAHEAVKDRVRADGAFPELVRCYGGRPSAVVPSRRARRIALGICERTGLAPHVWIGVAYGAAAETIEARKSGRP